MNPMTTHGAFSWLEHRGTDTSAARIFYQKILGWNVIDMPMQDGSTYPGITLDEQPIGGFSSKASNNGDWLAYITVDDVDERIRAAEEAGAEIISPPVDAPGVGRMAVIRDPQGASVALITYESKQA